MMDDNFYQYIISPLIMAVIGGLTYLGKRFVDKRDKKHLEEIEERNKRRSEIEDRLSKAEENVNKAETKADKANRRMDLFVAMVMGCEHSDCPTRNKISEITKKGEI